MKRAWTAKLAVAAAVVALALLTFGPEPNERNRESTTFERGPEGASAIFHLSERLGNETRRLRSSWEQLPEERGTLVVLNPHVELAEREVLRLRRWIAEGSTAVVASDDPGTLAALGLRTGRRRTWGRCAPGIVTRWNAGIERMPTVPDAALCIIADTASAVPFLVLAESIETDLKGDANGAASALRGAGAVGAVVPIGQGHLVVLTSDHWLRNAHIASQDNYRLAANLLANENSTVWFDEFHHRYRDGIGAIVAGNLPVALTVGFAALAVALVVWAQGVRFGRVMPATAAPVRRQAEYVDALGRLYDHGRAYPEALGELLDHVRREAGASTERLGTVSDERLLELVRRRWPEGVDTATDLIARVRSQRHAGRSELAEAGRTLETLRRKVLGHG